MNEVIKNILNRRSIRKYKNKDVEEYLIDEILKAGTYAPTGRNSQSPIIIAITNKDIKNKLAKINASVMNSNFDPFYGAPVVLVVLADKKIPTYLYDGCLVMENMMLAAHSLGLGSCWIHRAKETFETEAGKDLLKSWGLDESYEGVGNVILGYRDGELPKAKPRKENYIIYR